MRLIIQKEIDRLRHEIEGHNYFYYVIDQPKISDQEYDELFARLVRLEKENPDLVTPDSPTQRVGHVPVSSLKKIKHTVPMLSLDNVFSEEELTEFLQKLIDIGVKEFIVEPKLDGLAVEVVYEDGYLRYAATRGDGHTGEDITHNIKTSQKVPLKVADQRELKVRGEVVISKRNFERLNSRRVEEEKPPFATSRNAAAGAARQLDPRVAATRRLEFIAYACPTLEEDSESESHSDTLHYLTTIKLPSNSATVCRSIDEVISAVREIESGRDSFDFDIDGAVIKANTYRDRQKLGFTTRAPKWAMAYKYKAEQVVTIVEDISIQVGRTGVLTPVANLTPVKVGGVTVSKATLHNQDQIKEKNIHVGDVVSIQRAGDVIPEVVEVVEKKSEGYFILPPDCPECGSVVVQIQCEAAIRCVNAECPAQLLENLKHFVARNAFNIDGVGPKVLEQLVERGLVRGPADLFVLNEEKLLTLDKVGKRSATKLLRAISYARQTTPDRFLYALGIPLVGQEVSKKLIRHFQSIDKLIEAGETEIAKIDGLGPAVANSIRKFFDPEKPNLATFWELRFFVELVDEISEQKLVSDVLQGMTFVITGDHSKDREQIREDIEANGGKTSTSISKKTTALIAGATGSGPKKLQKAQDLGIDIWSEEDLYRKIKR